LICIKWDLARRKMEERRLSDCRERTRRQREVVLGLRQQGRSQAAEAYLIETLERTLLLMEQHQRMVALRYQQVKLQQV
jgi:hypothetical protein